MDGHTSHPPCILSDVCRPDNHHIDKSVASLSTFSRQIDDSAGRMMARDSCFGSVELPNLTTTSTCLVFSSSNTHCSGIRSTKERSIVSVSKKNATNNKTIPKEEQLLPETTGLLTGKTITERRIREKGLIQGQTWLDACAQQMKQNCDKISGVEDGILDLMKQTINQMKNMEAMQKELENAKMRENHLETMVAKLSLKIYDAQKEHFEAKLKEALRKSRHSRNQDLRLPSIGDRYSKSSGREGVGKARVLRNSALKRKAVGKVTMQAPKRRRNRLVKTCRACRIRKVKCDRGNPCSNCFLRGHPYVYFNKPTGGTST